jgi:hypothetical protein
MVRAAVSGIRKRRRFIVQVDCERTNIRQASRQLQAIGVDARAMGVECRAGRLLPLFHKSRARCLRMKR